jgi:hypothetical protein
MNNTRTLDNQINKAAFWSAITLIFMGVLSLFLPLDSPDGSFADRVTWLSSNIGVFIIAWIVQMIAMLALSAVFAGAIWHISDNYPLRAIVAGIVVLISVVAFIIPKFIAVWSIPLMVEAVSAGSGGSDIAEQLLNLLSISLPFSLFSSFDYLGFWLYAIFSLMLVRPLYHLTLSARIAAFGFGAYGLLFHVMLAGVLTGVVAQAEIGVYAEAIGFPLLIGVIGLAVYFKGRMSSEV